MNKRSLEAIAAVADKWPEWNPLLHFAAVANDETLDPVIRLDAARAAAAYMLPRPKPVEMEPDALVELESRLLRAKIEATADALDNPSLAERLARAKQKAAITIVMDTGVGRAPDDDIIDVTPSRAQTSQEARHGATSPSAGPAPGQMRDAPSAPAPAPVRPILPREPAPAADWQPPSFGSTPVDAAAAAQWPERPSFADMPSDNPFETEPYRDGLIGSRT